MHLKHRLVEQDKDKEIKRLNNIIWKLKEDNNALRLKNLSLYDKLVKYLIKECSIKIGNITKE